LLVGNRSVVQSARRRLLAYWTFSLLTIRFRSKNPLLWWCLSFSRHAAAYQYRLLLRLWHSCALPRFIVVCGDSLLLFVLPVAPDFASVSWFNSFGSLVHFRIPRTPTVLFLLWCQIAPLARNFIPVLHLLRLLLLWWDSFPIYRSHRSSHQCLPVY
jgi:hypothetical protein